MISTKMANISDYIKLKEEIYDIATNVKKEHFHKLKTHAELRKFGKGSITSKVWGYYNITSTN